jgi:predicted dehydrogenase
MKNIGILGCGNIARKMATTVNQMENANLYAAASRTYSKAQEFASEFNIDKAYGSYLELVQDENVDLVYVAVPHSHHYELIKLSLNNNKNVLCEKAFTVNAKMAKEVIELAKSKHLLLAEAIWTRYLPSRAIISDIIKSGVLGKISTIDANLGYNIVDHERIKKKELAGGALLDLTVYPINFALMFFPDEIRSIESSVTFLPKAGVDSMENVSLIYEDGKMASLRTSIFTNLDRRGVIYGDKGYLEITNINNPEKIVLYNTEYKAVKEYEIPKQITGFEYEVNECLEMIGKGKIECPSMPHSEIIKVMEVMDELRKQWDLHYDFE